MYKNNLVNDVHETRYIVSWLRAGGSLYYLEDLYDFRAWLESMDIAESDIDHIVYLATNGRLELEKSAEKFLKEHC